MSEKWEEVWSDGGGDYLDRFRVPGGWIYRTMRDLNFCMPNVMSDEQDKPVAVAMVFVPEAGRR